MFGVADDNQWKSIKEKIDSLEFYIFIIGNKYGSNDETIRISYTVNLIMRLKRKSLYRRFIASNNEHLLFYSENLSIS